MIRIAVRTLTLNVFRVEDEAMRKYILNSTAVPYFSNIVWFIRQQCHSLDRIYRCLSFSVLLFWPSLFHFCPLLFFPVSFIFILFKLENNHFSWLKIWGSAGFFCVCLWFVFFGLVINQFFLVCFWQVMIRLIVISRMTRLIVVVSCHFVPVPPLPTYRTLSTNGQLSRDFASLSTSIHFPSHDSVFPPIPSHDRDSTNPIIQHHTIVVTWRPT